MWAEHYKPKKVLYEKPTKKFRAVLIGGPGAGLKYELDMPTQTIMFPVLTRWAYEPAVYHFEWKDSEGVNHYRYVRTS